MALYPLSFPNFLQNQILSARSSPNHFHVMLVEHGSPLVVRLQGV